MNKKTISILLIISLSFNVAVLVMSTLKFREYHRNDKKEMLDHLRLIRNKAPEVHKKFRGDIRKITCVNRGYQQEFFKEIMLESPDYTKLGNTLQNITQGSADINQLIYSEIIEVRKKLTPEEAKLMFSHRLEMINCKMFEDMNPPRKEPQGDKHKRKEAENRDRKHNERRRPQRK